MVESFLSLLIKEEDGYFFHLRILVGFFFLIFIFFQVIHLNSWNPELYKLLLCWTMYQEASSSQSLNLALKASLHLIYCCFVEEYNKKELIYSCYLQFHRTFFFWGGGKGWGKKEIERNVYLTRGKMTYIWTEWPILQLFANSLFDFKCLNRYLRDLLQPGPCTEHAISIIKLE